MRTRTFIVGRDRAGQGLLAVLCGELHLPRADVSRALKEKRVRIDGQPCTQPERRLRAGQRVQVLPPPLPSAARDVVVRHADAQIVVVDKPAGLTTVRHADERREFGRGQKYLPPTLVDVLPGVLAGRGIKSKGRIRAVHRLDKETSGLVVLARTPEAESSLGRQFRQHTVGRRYLALVRGDAQEQRIESTLVADRGDGRRGSGPGGQRAVTHVRVVEALAGFTLVECRLETGRTHQVRIHLGEAGTPLCGERIYDRPPHGSPFPDASGALRPMLHAASLEIDHPATGDRTRWTAPLPRDMKALLERLRGLRKEK